MKNKQFDGSDLHQAILKIQLEGKLHNPWIICTGDLSAVNLVLNVCIRQHKVRVIENVEEFGSKL